jgi:hypothetical protein
VVGTLLEYFSEKVRDGTKRQDIEVLIEYFVEEVDVGVKG